MPVKKETTPILCKKTGRQAVKQAIPARPFLVAETDAVSEA